MTGDGDRFSDDISTIVACPGCRQVFWETPESECPDCGREPVVAGKQGMWAPFSSWTTEPPDSFTEVLAELESICSEAETLLEDGWKVLEGQEEFLTLVKPAEGWTVDDLCGTSESASTPSVEIETVEKSAEGETAVRYWYGETPVEALYCPRQTPRNPYRRNTCLIILSTVFAEFPSIERADRNEIDEKMITEFIRQEIGLYFSPDRYVMYPGDGLSGRWSEGSDFNQLMGAGESEAKEFVLVYLSPGEGVYIRDMAGEVVTEIVAPAEE